MKNSYQVGYLCRYMQKRAQDGLTDAQWETAKEFVESAAEVGKHGLRVGAGTGLALATGAGAAAGAGIAEKGKRLRGALIGGATGLVAAPVSLALATLAGGLAAKRKAIQV